MIGVVIVMMVVRPGSERHLFLVLREVAWQVQARGCPMHIANIVEARLVHCCVVSKGVHLVSAYLVRMVEVVQGSCYPRGIVSSHAEVF